ncbi:MAG: hypothetical protein NTY35_02150 [Planctomycetota bacterium]|nr:hypothetical protein [Planctomycetota bacterium]
MSSKDAEARARVLRAATILVALPRPGISTTTSYSPLRRATNSWNARPSLGLRARAHNAHAREAVARELEIAGLREPRFVAVRTHVLLSDKMDKMVVAARHRDRSGR